MMYIDPHIHMWARTTADYEAMAAAGVVAVIRAQSRDQLVGISEALLAGGVPSIEVTMSTPKAISGIELLADKFGWAPGPGSA